MGRRTFASSVYSPFARNDVRKRHAIQGGEAAHSPSTSSIDRAKHASLVHSTLTGPPPLPPFTRGKEEGRWRDLAQLDTTPVGDSRRAVNLLSALTSSDRFVWQSPWVHRHATMHLGRSAIDQ